MNKVKRFLIGAAAGVVMFGSSVIPAFAHQGHASCQGFGEGLVAAFAKTEGGVGEFIRELEIAPLNDDVAAKHPFFCTPK